MRNEGYLEQNQKFFAHIRNNLLRFLRVAGNGRYLGQKSKNKIQTYLEFCFLNFDLGSPISHYFYHNARNHQN